MGEDTKEVVVQEAGKEVNATTIKNLIYVIRGQQVMLDSDLAMLYQVETFCFQLTKEEYKNLIFQSGISSSQESENTHGGRRKLPYVFTEQGISMLSAVLRSEIAVKVSVNIMRTFVEIYGRSFWQNGLVLV